MSLHICKSISIVMDVIRPVTFVTEYLVIIFMVLVGMIIFPMTKCASQYKKLDLATLVGYGSYRNLGRFLVHSFIQVLFSVGKTWKNMVSCRSSINPPNLNWAFAHPPHVSPTWSGLLMVRGPKSG